MEYLRVTLSNNLALSTLNRLGGNLAKINDIIQEETFYINMYYHSQRNKLILQYASVWSKTELLRSSLGRLVRVWYTSLRCSAHHFLEDLPSLSQDNTSCLFELNNSGI